jgi:hypothetical protein
MIFKTRVSLRVILTAMVVAGNWGKGDKERHRGTGVSCRLRNP